MLPEELHDGASSQPAIKQVLEGMWWKHEANVTGFVTLSNAWNKPTTQFIYSERAKDRERFQPAFQYRA